MGGGCPVELICGDEGEGVQEEESSEALTAGEGLRATQVIGLRYYVLVIDT